MNTGAVPDRCAIRYSTGPCPNPAIDELGVCGPCLTVILSEPDPGRRRSLAGLPRIPIALLQRLAHDPDPGVRARVAARDALEPELVARFVDPTVEASPIVWRALAATRAGGRHAASLVTSRDRITLLVLATNSATDAAVLDLLAGDPDRRIAGAVAATRSGQPPDEAVIAEVLAARTIDTRPLPSPPLGTPWPGLPSALTHDGIPVDAVADAAGGDVPASHRGLVIGFVAVLVAVLAFAVLIITRGGGSTPNARGTPTSAGGISPPISATTIGPDRSSATSPHPGGVDTVQLEVTMTATQGRFCKRAKVRLVYDAPTAGVVITDDTGDELWQGSWPSGSTRTIQLDAPTRTLHAKLTTRADRDALKPSGSVTGTFC